jgi:hypothetical protein
MSKQNVNKKGKQTTAELSVGWVGAMEDAERHLQQAKQEMMEWKVVVRICGERISQGMPWPGAQARGQSARQQHSV